MSTDEAPPPGQAGTGKTFAEPVPATLLDAPLEYILVDHFRQRSLCAAMRRFAQQGRVDRAEVDAVVAYLRRDLGLHHRDEEEDLFPLLLRRALPEDDLAGALARLAEDHRQSRVMVEAIIEMLVARPGEDSVKLGRAGRKLLLDYAASEHHHLAAENGIVLAIARIRLTRGDLRTMSRSMRDRRGVPA
ncbi:hemerythrin domain-containing protein [Bosea sp. 124]|uniref:hemerythrin domain-containing protein n=1 Tax=Bosea sp. 124 TaxID=2135642 RepID=UPI000D4D0A24|nr:hemerythrin domain-containing protein [Bosea sp. 124]PTM42884.1 hemerythrin HHE cation binding domain-containing protein [Bosea sp. 124]